MVELTHLKICVVGSHGGHLAELLSILEAFKESEIFYITYKGFRSKELKKAFFIRNPSENLLDFMLGVLQIPRILIKERPHVVISLGAEIAIPVFYFAKLLGLRTIFIESACRVNGPSITGRIIYPIADLFLVQWPQLLRKYGRKARYEGSII